jgi:NADH pyrophosphatase NudC (nudix superfamily)
MISQICNHLVRFNFVSEIASDELHYDGDDIMNAKWFTMEEVLAMDVRKLWNGKSIKKIIEDVLSNRTFPFEFIQDVE